MHLPQQLIKPAELGRLMASDFGESSSRRALLAKALVGLDGPHIMGIVNATDDSFSQEVAPWTTNSGQRTRDVGQRRYLG